MINLIHKARLDILVQLDASNISMEVSKELQAKMGSLNKLFTDITSANIKLKHAVGEIRIATKAINDPNYMSELNNNWILADNKMTALRAQMMGLIPQKGNNNDPEN